MFLIMYIDFREKETLDIIPLKFKSKTLWIFIPQVMLLGDSGVGKTCLLTKFKDNTFLSGTFISTVGIDFRVSALYFILNHYMQLHGSKLIKLSKLKIVCTSICKILFYDCLNECWEGKITWIFSFEYFIYEIFRTR